MHESRALNREDDRIVSRLATLKIETDHAAPAALQRRSIRAWLWTTGAVALALVLGLFLGLGATPKRPESVVERSREAAPPPTSPASPAARSVEFVLGGYVRAGREVRLGAPVSGVVRAMFVGPGSRVVVGQRIAELANDTLRAQVEEARANLDTQEADVQELQHGPLDAELARAQAQVSALRVELAGATRLLERQRALAAEGLISRADLERAEEGRETAEARLEVGLRDEELLRQGARPERRRRADAALEEARAALRLAAAQVEQTVIRSPINGVVTKQHTEVGELVSAGFGGGASAAIVTIADVSQLIVEIDVPHSDLGRIRLGQQVRVESEALGDRSFSGRVSWIGPEANRQKLTVPIEVEVLGAAEGLLPGLSAKVTFLPAAAPEASTGGAVPRQSESVKGGNLP